MNGPRMTVNFSILVGSGTGPMTAAPGAFRRLDDLLHRLIEHAVIVAL